MTDYRFEELTPGHFAELGPLMTDAFGEAVPAGLFEWKYLRNPSGPAVGRVARADDGSLAAFYGMIPERYVTGGETRLIYQSCDTMTHSAHRRRGLFQKLALATYAAAEAADERFFAFGFSGPMSTPGFVKMGWRIEAELPHLFRPFPLTLLTTRRAGEVEPVDVDDPRLIATMTALAAGGDGVLRDPAFLQWRLANPMRHYRALLIPDRAFAIFTLSQAMLFLVDFAEVGRGAGKSILGQLAFLSRKEGGKGVLTWSSPASPMAQALRRGGYLRNPFGRGPASHRVPLISYGRHPDGRWMRDLPISPLDHDSL